MGLIRGIAEAVLEKAKVEMKDYIIKFIEAEKEAEKEAAGKAAVIAEKPAEPVQAEEKEPEVPEKRKEIFPIVEKDLVKYIYRTKPELISIPRELADLMQMLPVGEFACFMKLFIFTTEQKKNFGYIGNNLKKKIGLDALSPEEFEELIANLEAYGLMKVEQVSDNQRTFILYIPFDEETMSVSEMPRTEKQPERNESRNSNQQKKAPARKEPEKAEKKTPVKAEPVKEEKEEDDRPGRSRIGMEDDELYKSYRTFVNLEIDKAKMRVGRSNFDKIYMEAVKYIDKKYGFKVLSDSEKFKEHLTNYYISAFDIKSFEEWKKSK
ncbi:MAG TPA: hypothetical protein P5044_01300 [bacterium]|nr:hypothetical protein [bacterium]